MCVKRIQKLIILLFIFLMGYSVTVGSSQSMPNASKIDDTERKEIVRAACTLIKEKYLEAEIAEKVETFIGSKFDKGEYNNINNGIQLSRALTMDFFSISKDKHLWIRFDPPEAERSRLRSGKNPEDVRKGMELWVEEERYLNYGFEKVERLRGNIGYLKLRMFFPSEYAGDTAAAAVAFLANTDAIIIDLRENQGGAPSMVQFLASYFVEKKPVLLTSTVYPRKNKTHQTWSLPYVPGKRLADKDVYILTSRHIFSAPEGFAFALKRLKRATIVGEKTAGGSHLTRMYPIAGKYVLAVPYGKPLDPETGTGWEGKGIKPDVSVPANIALEKAHLLALEKIITNKKKPLRIRMLQWKIDELKARVNPYQVGESVLKSYAGSYEGVLVTYERGQLYFKVLRTGNEYRLFPMSDTLFALEGIEYLRIRFEVESTGRVTRLFRVFDRGGKAPARRLD